MFRNKHCFSFLITFFPAFFLSGLLLTHAAPEVLDSGTTGPLSYHVVYDAATGEPATLTVFGTGAMPDYTLTAIGSTAPWYHSKSEISANPYKIMKVVIGDGVTHIGDNAFINYADDPNDCIIFLRRDVTVPDSVVSIGSNAFWGNEFSDTFMGGRITIPNSVKSIGKDAINSTVTIVCYEGSTASGYAQQCGNRTQIPGQSSSAEEKPAEEEVHYSLITFKYVLNGGKNNKANPSQAANDEVITLKNPTRKGYIFAGWYAEASFKTRVKVLRDNGISKVYAKWNRIKTGRPTVPKLSSPSKGKLKIAMKKVSKAAGYQVQYSLKKSFPKSATKAKNISKLSLILKLRSNKTWYVRVRAYRNDSAGRPVYGSWSKIAKQKVK